MLIRTLLVWVIVVPALLCGQTLHGVGSSFPYPLYSEWSKSYKKANHAVKLHYSPTGSAKGVDQFIEGKADFAATEETLTDAQLRTAKQTLGADILQIPTVLGAVVPIYRISGLDVELNFTGAALAGIYLGKITRWNDPAIVESNPGVPLPDAKITVVHRSDDNHTTYLWTDFLSKVSPEWKAGPGKGLSVKWPIGLGTKYDDGVEDLVIGAKPKGDYGIEEVVSGIPNSIGYVQLHYAIANQLPYGDVQNASGTFARAAESSIMAEAASAEKSIPEAFRLSLANAPSPTGYPISSFTWILVPANMQDKAKSKAMSDFLKWMLKGGQDEAEALHYVRLPANIVDAALAEVAKLQ